jgi:hypothetical protein
MITDFSYWVDFDIARFKNVQKISKIEIYKKKRKRKVKGLI